MEDHHHHQYGMADLRHYIANARPNFFPQPPPPDLMSGGHPSYEMLVFRPDSNSTAGVNAAVVASATAASSFGGGFESGPPSGGGGDGTGTGRWPRQETLTLLEIRSRLDAKFKEANHKGPLWDELSRIMSEEHGYQRSGKKCREKFENLYKYYKKTKEGKAGRQDGKHYRFFRQLEALYGESNNNNSASASDQAHHHNHHHIGGSSFHHYNNFPNKNPSSSNNQDPFQSCPKLSDNTSLSLSNYSDADTTSSDDTGLNDDDRNDEPKSKKRSGRMGWKSKIKDFIDSQMKKLMDRQEDWMEKMMRTIERKEQERMMREEQWRKQDAERIEREHKFWASERAWIEARDASLMEALHKLTGKDQLSENQNENDSETILSNTVKGEIWPESEITRLIQLKSAMDVKFEQRGLSEEVLWEEIANKMGCFGHERRSALMCKDKWESVNNYLLKCNKKRKENTKSCNFYDHHQSNNNVSNQGVYCDASEQGVEPTVRLNHDHQNSSPNTNNGGNMSESCFRYFMGDAFGRIMD